MMFGVVSLLALVAGVLFAFPIYYKDFVVVEINNASMLAEVAGNAQARQKGLGGRDDLPKSGGMLFFFPSIDFHAIWMKDMRFPIDIFWIKDGTIVDLEENAPAPVARTDDSLLPVYQPDVAAEAILETRAGTARKYEIHIGDRVRIIRKGWLTLAREPHVEAYDEEASGNAEIKPPSKGSEYAIETIRRTPGTGKNFRMEEKVGQTDAYEKYKISYQSGDLTISGVMNVPLEPPPEGGFPTLILNHGLITPEIYFSGRGSKREQDFFARHGYVTIHPDYRGLASSSPNPSVHHDFYAGYAEDVMNLIDAVKELGADFIDVNRLGLWGHSMGGGIAARVMVVRPEIRAYVLFAPISADVEENFYELSEDELAWLESEYGSESEAKVIYEKISPLSYFKDVSAPVQLHHGTADTAVPIHFSEEMYAALVKNGKKAEFFVYPGQKHEFIEDWPLASERALQFFDHYVKNAR